METKVFNMQGAEVSTVKLEEKIFANKAHPQTINLVVKAHLNNQRQGNASTKNRSEVKGSGKKIYKQKGTGRARHGDRYAPIFTGGGVAFGPRPRTFDQRLPQKMVRRALMGALTELYEHDRINVVQDAKFETGKTKEAASYMKNNGYDKMLFVVNEIDPMTVRATSNLPQVKIVTPMHVNTYDLLKYGRAVIDREALDTLQEVLVK
ncbi:MAG: 50S ribosomal protein L4 [Candidatus Riflebacteria bacterium]|nr:50S ribosomal protein L4 [Candidatus Riflebacteria bacterium]